MKLLLKAAALLLCATWVLLAHPEDSDQHTYKSGYSSMMKLGKDIHNALKPAQREIIAAQPISIETDVTPFARLLYYSEEPKPIRGVWISAGFIDLVNNLAHAKAIDSRQKGYFDRYIALLAQENGENTLKPLPNDSNPAYWTDDMLNEQLSNFNSIVGVIVSIKLANHYLGQYDKYKDRIEKEDHPPINNFLSEKEWNDAFQAGVRNALNAGCTVEGAIPFFEAFEKMKKRPAWAAYFLPDNVKFKKLKKEMQQIQEKFFSGDE